MICVCVSKQCDYDSDMRIYRQALCAQLNTLCAQYRTLTCTREYKQCDHTHIARCCAHTLCAHYRAISRVTLFRQCDACASQSAQYTQSFMCALSSNIELYVRNIEQQSSMCSMLLDIAQQSSMYIELYVLYARTIEQQSSMCSIQSSMCALSSNRALCARCARYCAHRALYCSSTQKSMYIELYVLYVRTIEQQRASHCLDALYVRNTSSMCAISSTMCHMLFDMRATCVCISCVYDL